MMKMSIAAKHNIEQQLLDKLKITNKNLRRNDLPCFEEITDNISAKEEAYNNIKNNFERLELLLFKSSTGLNQNLSRVTSTAYLSAQESINEEQSFLHSDKKDILKSSFMCL